MDILRFQYNHPGQSQAPRGEQRQGDFSFPWIKAGACEDQFGLTLSEDLQIKKICQLQK